MQYSSAFCRGLEASMYRIMCSWECCLVEWVAYRLFDLSHNIRSIEEKEVNKMNNYH